MIDATYKNDVCTFAQNRNAKIALDYTYAMIELMLMSFTENN